MVPSRWCARLIALVLVLSGLAQAVYGGLMHLSDTNLELFGTTIPHASQASGGFVNRNHLAGFLEITLALDIGLMVGSLRETGRRRARAVAARHAHNDFTQFLVEAGALGALLAFGWIALYLEDRR